MRVFLLVLTISLSGVANAEVFNCEISRINGANPTNPSSIAFDPDKVLMEINRGNGRETLLNIESVYVIDANALWYTRSECQYKRSEDGPSTIQHSFDCGDDVQTVIKIKWDSTRATGDFESVLQVPNMPTEKFVFDFQNCKLISTN